MNRKDLRVAEFEWRSTDHRSFAVICTKKRKCTFGDVLNAIWRKIFA